MKSFKKLFFIFGFLQSINLIALERENENFITVETDLPDIKASILNVTKFVPEFKKGFEEKNIVPLILIVSNNSEKDLSIDKKSSLLLKLGLLEKSINTLKINRAPFWLKKRIIKNSDTELKENIKSLLSQEKLEDLVDLKNVLKEPEYKSDNKSDNETESNIDKNKIIIPEENNEFIFIEISKNDYEKFSQLKHISIKINFDQVTEE